MSAFLKLLLSLMALIATVILGVRMLASRAEVAWPFPLNTFNTSGCVLPCWHNIHPGVTTLEQAESIMSTDPLYERVLTENEYGLHRWQLIKSQTEQNHVTLGINEQQIVKTIYVRGSSSTGELVAVLGSPKAVFAYERYWHLIYSSRQGTIEIVNFQASAICLGATLIQRLPIYMVLSGDSRRPTAALWYGFRSVQPETDDRMTPC